MVMKCNMFHIYISLTKKSFNISNACELDLLDPTLFLESFSPLQYW